MDCKNCGWPMRNDDGECEFCPSCTTDVSEEAAPVIAPKHHNPLSRIHGVGCAKCGHSENLHSGHVWGAPVWEKCCTKVDCGCMFFVAPPTEKEK